MLIHIVNLQPRPLLKLLHHKFHRSLIPKHTQSRDNPHSLIAEVAVVSPALPSMNIRHMQLDKRNTCSKQRIPDRNRSMGESARVDDYAVDMGPRFVDPIDNGAFVVRLECFKSCAERGGV